MTKSILVAFAILLGLPTVGLGQTAEEYAIKAAYMARFAEFTRWPEETAKDTPSRTFVLSVIGDAPFRDIFERTYLPLKIGNKNIEVRYVSSIEESEGSQILFVSRSETGRLEQIIAFTRDKPILTVSDAKAFAGQGVIINFYLEGEKVRFEIDPSAVEGAGLWISSLLLSYARIVGPERAEP